MKRALSPRTVACYRDALMLFLDFTSRKLGKTPTDTHGCLLKWDHPCT